MKIRAVGAELFLADRQTDRHDEANGRFSALLRKGKGKVKCTLVQALRLCTGTATHRESRGIALLFLDHGTRRG